MSNCEDYANWSDLDETARLAALGQAINDLLTKSGYQPVSITSADTGKNASTDLNNGNITFDGPYLSGAGRNDAYQTAFHETKHSMDVQDGFLDMLSDEERASLNDILTYALYTDQDGELRARISYELPEHDDAETFGDYMADGVADECGGTPAPSPAQAYGSKGGDEGLDINWDENAGPSAPGSGSGETVGDGAPGAAGSGEGGFGAAGTVDRGFDNASGTGPYEITITEPFVTEVP